ncbi:selenoprotein H-like, partial [Haliotis rufescens]
RVFERRATELADALRSHFSEVNLTLNPEKPRRGSFEITLTTEDGSDVLVWTGLKKGPPRKLKFPDSDAIAKEIQKNLK